MPEAESQPDPDPKTLGPLLEALGQALPALEKLVEVCHDLLPATADSAGPSLCNSCRDRETCTEQCDRCGKVLPTINQKANIALQATEPAGSTWDSISLKALFNKLPKAQRKVLHSYVWAINNGCAPNDKYDDIHHFICSSFDDHEIFFGAKEPCPAYDPTKKIPGCETWSRTLRRAVETAKKKFGIRISETLEKLGLLRRNRGQKPQGRSIIRRGDI